MTNTLDENTTEVWDPRTCQWTDQYEEALFNKYSLDALMLLQLHRTASTSSITAPLANTQMEASVSTLDTELACNNTVLDSQMQVSTPSSTTLTHQQVCFYSIMTLKVKEIIPRFV